MIELVVVLVLIALTPILIMSQMYRSRGGRRPQVKRGGFEDLDGPASADSYPFYRKMKTLEHVKESFECVKDVRLKIVPADYKILNMPNLTPAQRKFRGKSQIVEFEESDYTKMNWLSDWFNEKCRLRCRRYDEELSPLDLWERKGSRLAAQITDVGSMMRVNDKFYEIVKGCNNFRPSLARGIIRATGARSQLDPSAGWGDRLIGAAAAGIRYVGVDPNTCVHAGYREIIETFGCNASMIESPFETAELPAGETFDLVMTSPPYFDLEIYSAAESQSVVKYSGLAGWMTGFLMPSLRKAWEVLNPGGYMCIIINITRGGPDYVSDMVKQVCEFDQCDYMGLLPYGVRAARGHKSPQPMWIWQKKAELTIEPLSADHIDSLEVIASDPAVMTHIAAGKSWTRDKIQSLVDYGNDESYKHWAIMYGKIVVGYVGLYPLGDSEGLQFRIFLNSFEHGRGYGGRAVKLVIDEYRRTGTQQLYMQAHEGNTGSVRLAISAGFTKVPGSFKIGKHALTRYVYEK